MIWHPQRGQFRESRPHHGRRYSLAINSADDPDATGSRRRQSSTDTRWLQCHDYI